MTNTPEKTIAMNLEDTDLKNMETKNPRQEPATFFDEDEEPVDAARVFPLAGRPRGFHRPLFVIGGLALCMGLASCVVPYDSYDGGSVSVTRYSPGYSVASLPGGYRSEVISGRNYYYHDGYYYNRGSGGYVVVDAPRRSRYYDDYSRRQKIYQTNRNHRGPSGRNDPRYDSNQVITRLPTGYRMVNHRGQRYYQSGNRYYLRQGDSYVITTSPYRGRIRIRPVKIQHETPRTFV